MADRKWGGMASANALAISVRPPTMKAALERRAVLIATSGRAVPKRLSVTARTSEQDEEPPWLAPDETTAGQVAGDVGGCATASRQPVSSVEARYDSAKSAPAYQRSGQAAFAKSSDASQRATVRSPSTAPMRAGSIGSAAALTVTRRGSRSRRQPRTVARAIRSASCARRGPRSAACRRSRPRAGREAPRTMSASAVRATPIPPRPAFPPWSARRQRRRPAVGRAPAARTSAPPRSRSTPAPGVSRPPAAGGRRRSAPRRRRASAPRSRRQGP